MRCHFLIFGRIVTLLLLLSVAGKASGQSVELPDRRVGDSCTMVRSAQGRALQPIKQAISEMTPDGYKTEGRNPGGFVVETWEFDSSGNPKSRRSTAGTITWLPHQPFFRWPMKPGDEWREEYRYSLPNGSGKVRVLAQVVAWESVFVAAGNFQALKVNLSGRYEEETSVGVGSGQRDFTLWFDPRSGCVAKSSLRATRWDGSAIPEESLELVEFSKASR